MFLSDMNASSEDDHDAIDLQQQSLAFNISAFCADKGQTQQKQVQAQTLPPSHGEDLAMLRLLELGSAPASDPQDQYIPAIESNLETIEPNLVSFPISTAETQKTVPGSMLPIQGESMAAMTPWGVMKSVSQQESFLELLDLLGGADTTTTDLRAGLGTKRRRSLDSPMSVANVVGQLQQSRQYQESNLANQSLVQSVVGLQSATEGGSLFPQIAGLRGMPTASQGEQSHCLSLPTGVSQGAKLAAPQEESAHLLPGLQRISGMNTTASILQWQQVDGQTRSQWAPQQQQINMDKPAAGSQWQTHQNGWNPLEVGLHRSQGQSFQKVPDQKATVLPNSQAQGSMMQLTGSHVSQQQLDEVQEKVEMQCSFLPARSNLLAEESYDLIMKSGSVQLQDHSLSLAAARNAQAPGMLPSSSNRHDFLMGNPNLPILPSRSNKTGPQSYTWCQGGQTDGGFPSRGNKGGPDTAGTYATATSLLPGLGGVVNLPVAQSGSNPPRGGDVAADATLSYTGTASASSGNILLPAGNLRQQLPSPILLRPLPGQCRSFSDPTLSSSSKVGGSVDLSITRSNSVPPPVGSRTDIKRPRSAYNFFYRSERTRLLDEMGQTKRKIPLEIMTKTIAGRWKSLTNENRAPFKRLANTDKERYERELRDFNIQERKRLEDLRKESNSP